VRRNRGCQPRKSDERASRRNSVAVTQVGFRESAQSWKELLVDLKGEGLTIAPDLATGVERIRSTLGFWKVLDQVFLGKRERAFAGISGAPCARRRTS